MMAGTTYQVNETVVRVLSIKANFTSRQISPRWVFHKQGLGFNNGNRQPFFAGAAGSEFKSGPGSRSETKVFPVTSFWIVLRDSGGIVSLNHHCRQSTGRAARPGIFVFVQGQRHFSGPHIQVDQPGDGRSGECGSFPASVSIDGIFDGEVCSGGRMARIHG
jgi:hypothetical protein